MKWAAALKRPAEWRKMFLKTLIFLTYEVLIYSWLLISPFFSIFSPLCFIVRALAHNNMFHYVKIVCKENASSDNSCSTMRTTLNHQNSVLHFFVFLDYFLSFRENFIQKNWHKIIWISNIFSYWYIFFSILLYHIYFCRMGDMLENPNQPASVHIQNVQGTSSSSIKVSWKLDNTGGIQSSSSSNTNQVNTAEVNTVDGFYILYRSCIGEPPGFTSITVLHAAATSYVVNRLEPYTPYEFLVIPFHRGLSGKPSALHRAQTLEARPNLAPIQLQWYQVCCISLLDNAPT